MSEWQRQWQGQANRHADRHTDERESEIAKDREGERERERQRERVCVCFRAYACRLARSGVSYPNKETILSSIDPYYGSRTS